MKTHTTILLGTIASAALALSACGSSGSNDAAQGQQAHDTEGLTEVSIGVVPVGSSVGIYYGIENGIFEKYGLDVELTTSSAGAATLPAVANGQLSFGVGNPLSVMVAADQGLDMRIVSGYSNSLAEGDDILGVVTRTDSGIESYADLEDHTTAVNALKTQGDLTIMDLAEQEGADPAKVNFSEISFPDMIAQLEQGNADAIWVTEPFLSQALEDQDNRLIGSNFQDSIPGLPTQVTFTSGKFADENPEIVESFQAAVTESLIAANEDEVGARAMLPEFIEMPEDAAQALRMEDLDGELRVKEVQDLGDLAVKYEFLEGSVNWDTVIIK